MIDGGIIKNLEAVAHSRNTNLTKYLKTGDVNDISMEILTDYFSRRLNDSSITEGNIQEWNSHVASPEGIIEDIGQTLSSVKTLDSFTLKSNFAPRATIGHINAGHLIFSGDPKINTTLDDVISDEVLSFVKKGKSPIYINQQDFLLETQNSIDYVADRVHDAIENPDRMLDITQGGISIPLFGVPFWNVFDSQAFLKGIFFGGYFDNYDKVRKYAEKRFNIEMGGGSSYIVHKPTIQKLGISLAELTKANYVDPILDSLHYKKRIELFKNIGLIKEMNDINFDYVDDWNDVKDQCVDYMDLQSKDYFQEYIRFEKGNGVSDDIACMAAAWIDFNPRLVNRDGHYYKSLSNGANINDFVDTMTKASLLYAPAGFDEVIAKFANTLWLRKVRTDPRYRQKHNINLHRLEKRLETQGTEEFALVSKNDVQNLTAISKNPVFTEIHSSARYFMRMHEDSYALEQWAMLNQRRLGEYGANVEIMGKKGPKKLFEENFKITMPIGFNKVNLNKIISYADSRVFPLLASPDGQEELIAERYKNELDDLKYR